MSSCRYCKEGLREQDGGVRYGPRHYAHLACLKKAYTEEAFVNMLKKIPTWRLRQIPYFVAKDLGILPLLHTLVQHFEPGILDIHIIADKFPKTFGLRAFPGDVFKIGRQSSYISEGRVMLYTQVLRGEQWLDFAKGTEEELRAQIVEVPS